MKAQTIIFSCIAAAVLTAAIAVLAFALAVGGSQKNENAATVPDTTSHSDQAYFTANSTASQETTENSQVSTSSNPVAGQAVVYLVKEWNGKIGVFAEGEETPIQTLDVAVDNLPEGDQELLRKGISVEGKEALRRTLEDYES